MAWLIRIKDLILTPYTKYTQYKMRKKRIAELRQRDPFIYK